MNTMKKFTPGPWAWSGDGIKTCLWLLDEHNDAVLSGDIKVWSESDAILIAAAPDLYTELRHLVALLEPLEREGSLHVPGLATLNGARAALARADGKP